jgi:hypothetical protein
MLSRLRPSFVVESGAFEGHTTWIVRQACPEAQIVSLDPAIFFFPLGRHAIYKNLVNVGGEIQARNE